MKKRIIAILLVAVIGVTFLAGCTDSSQDTIIEDVGYDPAEEVAKYDLGELSDADKDFTIQMGYRDCDHMVAAIIGEEAGIYEALGLDVEVTKTGSIMEAMSSGEMHVGYQGLGGAIRSVNEGAPLFMAAANHLTGSVYLVASNDIEEPEDLLGKKLAIGSRADVSPSWRQWANELGIPMELDNYEAVDMSDSDALFALRAGQLDAFSACDPYASQAEFEGHGKIIGTEWGSDRWDDKDLESAGIDDWGAHCIYVMNSDFREEHPELANRLVLAHSLALKYVYQHPYSAGMMFAEGFGVDPEVGLRTIYLKTAGEGRTLAWQFSEQNLDNYIQFYYDMEIPEEEIPNIDDINRFMSTDLLGTSGIEDFAIFVEEEVDDIFPVGMEYIEWMEKAMEIDGIEGDPVELAAVWAGSN